MWDIILSNNEREHYWTTYIWDVRGFKMLGQKHWKNDTLSIVFPSSLNCNMIKVYPEKREDKRIIYRS